MKSEPRSQCRYGSRAYLLDPHVCCRHPRRALFSWRCVDGWLCGQALTVFSICEGGVGRQQHAVGKELPA